MVKKLSYQIRTYGCQANVRDSEIISGLLNKKGFKLAKKDQIPDIFILNTCAVRENAEKKVFGEIGFLQKYKKKKPNLIIGICGCMSHEKNITEKFKKTDDKIDFIIGTRNIDKIIETIKKLINEKKQIFNVSLFNKNNVDLLPSKRSSKIKAFVNIMYGCNQFCSYCIVPFTRGRIQSRDEKEILNEINDLIKKGYKEVTLIGQNVNSYGEELKNKNINFKNLLIKVAKTNIPRIRFCTSNPWNFTKDIIDVMVKYKNIMPYVHLPIQSGDEGILKKMNREMKISSYIKIIKTLREKIPNCSISTDIIVGFPNESESQFKKTLDLVNLIKFDNIYCFIYSKRENTKAALMKDTIDLNVKKERLAQLNALVRKYAKLNNEKFINKTVEVLIEGRSKTNKNYLTGYCPEWKVVNFKGNGKIGDIVKVKIISASNFSLNGVMVNEP